MISVWLFGGLVLVSGGGKHGDRSQQASVSKHQGADGKTAELTSWKDANGVEKTITVNDEMAAALDKSVPNWREKLTKKRLGGGHAGGTPGTTHHQHGDKTVESTLWADENGITAPLFLSLPSFSPRTAARWCSPPPHPPMPVSDARQHHLGVDPTLLAPPLSHSAAPLSSYA